MTIEELMSLSKGDMVASGSEIIKVFKKPKRCVDYFGDDYIDMGGRSSNPWLYVSDAPEFERISSDGDLKRAKLIIDMNKIKSKIRGIDNEIDTLKARKNRLAEELRKMSF